MWLDRAPDVDLAIDVVEAMAAQAKHKNFRKYLEMRAARLRGLRDLRLAADAYEKRFGSRPSTLDALVASGLVQHLPTDPFGFGYGLDGQGRVFLRNVPLPTEKR